MMIEISHHQQEHEMFELSVQEHPRAGMTRALAAMLKTLWLFFRKENVKNLSGPSPSKDSWDGQKHLCWKWLWSDPGVCRHHQPWTCHHVIGAALKIWYEHPQVALSNRFDDFGSWADMVCMCWSGFISEMLSWNLSAGWRSSITWIKMLETKMWIQSRRVQGGKSTFGSKLINLRPSFCYKTEAWKKVRGKCRHNNSKSLYSWPCI